MRPTYTSTPSFLHFNLDGSSVGAFGWHVLQIQYPSLRIQFSLTLTGSSSTSIGVLSTSTLIAMLLDSRRGVRTGGEGWDAESPRDRERFSFDGGILQR